MTAPETTATVWVRCPYCPELLSFDVSTAAVASKDLHITYTVSGEQGRPVLLAHLSVAHPDQQNRPGAEPLVAENDSDDAFLCGHLTVTAGCGGCDPAAIDLVLEDGSRTPRSPTLEDFTDTTGFVVLGMSNGLLVYGRRLPDADR